MDDLTRSIMPEPKPTSAATAFDAPSRIGPYRILETLGEGGFGFVYLAEQVEPVRRRVALKVIKPGMDSRQIVARFEAEEQALALMDHPNVAKVLGAGVTEQGRPYFVMEHVRGVSITEHCDRQKLGIEDRLRLLVQVCDAIQHAHQKGIIHRDIKPSNILVTIEDGRAVPRIIDFGVAKALNQRLTEKTLFTEQGQLLGTPEYMSPEQAEMTAQDVDTRSDIYALGVLLYELLTGVLPFDPRELREAGLGEIQRIIREVEPSKPSTRLMKVSDATAAAARHRHVERQTLHRRLRGDLDWITMKAMDKDRTRRYATASEFAADIRRHLEHEPVVAGPPSTMYRVTKFVRRHRTGVGAAGVVVLVLALATAGITWQAIRATRAEGRALELARSESFQRERAERALREAETSREQAAVQLERAEQQAAIAQAVNDFLNHDLLAAADPRNTPNPDVTLREVLDAASRRISGRFEDQPLVLAASRMALGNTYESLGEYDLAEPHFEHALRLWQNELGETDRNALRAMDHLGRLRYRQGRHESAQTMLVEALERQRELLGDDDLDTLTTMNDLAALYRATGRFNDAEALLLENLRLSRAVLPDDHPHTPAVMGNLASLYWERGRHDEAESLWLEAIGISRRALGDEHPDTLAWMNDLATLYRYLGRFDEAEPLLVRALEARRRVLGDDHPETLGSKLSIADLYRREGRFDDAEPLLREVYETRRSRLGPRHAHTLHALNLLASLRVDQGRLDEAEPLYLEVLEGRQDLSTGHTFRLTAMSNVGRLYTLQGRYGEAEQMLRETIAVAREHLGTDHWYTGIYLQRYGECLMKMDRQADAEQAFLEGYEILSSTIGDDHERTHNLVASLATLYEAWGRDADARAWRMKLPPELATDEAVSNAQPEGD
jgi:serine/threonine protein kinase/Flp pilus assembly protein TadD